MSHKKEEEVLVVNRQDFNPDWIGLNTDRGAALNLLASVKRNPTFLPRFGVAEKTEEYLQIIPWYMYQNINTGEYFVGQRSNNGKEKELRNQYVLGFGGHIWPTDLLLQQYIEWGSRELREELMVSGPVYRRLLGMVYQDQKPVERRHLGIAYLIQGNGSISLNRQNKDRQEYASGQLMPSDQIQGMQLDSWSQSVFDSLTQQPIAPIGN